MTYRIATTFLTACLMTGCGPHMAAVTSEIEQNPLMAILAPITLPLAVVHDGVHAATGATAADVGRVLDVGIAGTAAATGVVAASRPATAYSPSSGTGYAVPAPGYSQRGALEACADLYERNGDHAGAARCRADASRLSSMTPVK